ncbi:methyl-accepting chemotaxis protein [Acidovorax delafieldii]|uniref:Methyl-accepting chemotaxis protein n=1 Tax=Acidovorax delafieldii TaxID=47920 RepID=A0AAJ2BPI2_ACIDE|nr:methyl-accepting chemotaxis protein [Acidovorax delafieldii]MDR6766012.1 methyl-accepting chemotaxis protein [Acidovorax delafieldii]MDR6837050.1 methyl-accepting chemotaxis protein [Acidovorax delafieldii]MDR7366541.1 methyl-accepting chemotaxis protein [Acidovorax delafieldii]
MPKQLRMAHKLWLAVILIVVMLVAVVGFAAYRSAKVQAQADAVSKEMEARVQAALRWSGLTETNAARTQALIVSNDPAVEAEFKDVIAATSAQISEVQKSLESMALSDADKAQMNKIAAARKTMIDLRGEARKLKGDGQQDQAVTLINQKYNPSVVAYLTALREFVAQQQKNAADTQAAMAAERMLTVKIAAVAVALLLLAIIVGAYYLIGSIQRPLAQAHGLAERIAGGDLSQQESVTRGDEFGDLLRSLYAMSNALGRMVHQVRQSTDSIAIASAEIATGNQDLSARTEQTSSNLQETAAAMEEFTSTIQQSAGSAQQASSLAAGATGVARRGGEVVTQVVATMEDINHSSKKIADIIGVIDGIAFQTNILALNAAVEAARAGEQGRGFAVVASEVRSLAQRSAEAAKEIKQLISASVEKVETGSRLVSDAGTTMTDIVQSVQRVTDMIGEITAASSEQSAGVSQVNKAISNLDQMTQQNAALVEESAAAAQSLREQADHLAREVSMFKVNAASYGPAQAAIGAARGAAKVTASLSPARAAPAPAGSGTTASAARIGTTGAPAALAKAPAPSTVAKTGSQKNVKQGAAAGAEEDWESF